MAAVSSRAAAFQPEMDSPEQSFDGSDKLEEEAEDPWADLRRVIIDAGLHLSPDEELRDLNAAESAVIARDTERQDVTDKLQAELRVLSKALATATSSAQRPATVLSPAEHNAQIRSLEQQHYATGKALNEEQSNVAKKEVELGKWRSEKEVVGRWEVGEVEGEGNATNVMKLKILNDLGFRLMPSSDSSNPKLLIRNDAKNDVHSVMVDTSRSKAYWANTIWNMASE